MTGTQITSGMTAKMRFLEKNHHFPPSVHHWPSTCPAPHFDSALASPAPRVLCLALAQAVGCWHEYTKWINSMSALCKSK